MEIEEFTENTENQQILDRLRWDAIGESPYDEIVSFLLTFSNKKFMELLEIERQYVEFLDQDEMIDGRTSGEHRSALEALERAERIITNNNEELADLKIRILGTHNLSWRSEDFRLFMIEDGDEEDITEWPLEDLIYRLGYREKKAEFKGRREEEYDEDELPF